MAFLHSPEAMSGMSSRAHLLRSLILEDFAFRRTSSGVANCFCAAPVLTRSFSNLTVHEDAGSPSPSRGSLFIVIVFRTPDGPHPLSLFAMEARRMSSTVRGELREADAKQIDRLAGHCVRGVRLELFRSAGACGCLWKNVDLAKRCSVAHENGSASEASARGNPSQLERRQAKCHIQGY